MNTSSASNYWTIMDANNREITRVYGETMDDAKLAADLELDRKGGYGMRRLQYCELRFNH